MANRKLPEFLRPLLLTYAKNRKIPRPTVAGYEAGTTDDTPIPALMTSVHDAMVEKHRGELEDLQRSFDTKIETVAADLRAEKIVSESLRKRVAQTEAALIDIEKATQGAWSGTGKAAHRIASQLL